MAEPIKLPITSENLWEIVKDIVRTDAERILAEHKEETNG
jgi:hypothetical protein